MEGRNQTQGWAPPGNRWHQREEGIYEEYVSLEASRKTFKFDTHIFPNGDRITYTRWLALHQALRISLTTFAWLGVFILVPVLLTRQLRPRESYLRSYSQEMGVAVTQKCPVPQPGLGGPGRDVGGCINLVERV